MNGESLHPKIPQEMFDRISELVLLEVVIFYIHKYAPSDGLYDGLKTSIR